jgi:hypothetical protein
MEFSFIREITLQMGMTNGLLQQHLKAGKSGQYDV